MAVYMLLDCVGRSPYRWEAPEECSLIGTLYIWECVRSTGKERVRRDLRRGLLKRAPESYAKRVGKSRSQEAGNSSSPKVDQLTD